MSWLLGCDGGVYVRAIVRTYGVLSIDVNSRRLSIAGYKLLLTHPSLPSPLPHVITNTSLLIAAAP